MIALLLALGYMALLFTFTVFIATISNPIIAGIMLVVILMGVFE